MVQSADEGVSVGVGVGVSVGVFKERHSTSRPFADCKRERIRE